MKLTFKQFLAENGFPFANVSDDKKITIFGHTEENLDKNGKKNKSSKEENKKRKLNRYFQYAKVVDEE